MKTLAALLLLLAACQKSSISKVSTNNPNMAIELLFEHDGCRVYRFFDDRAIYFAKCDGVAADVTWTEHCGKGCTRTVNVPTGTP